MKGIEIYLEKFKYILHSDAALKETISEVLQTTLKLPPTSFTIEVKHGVVKVAGSPILRSVVFRKKEAVLEEMRVRLGKSVVVDIR